MTAKDALRATMEFHDFRVEDIAVKTGLNVKTVYRILNGKEKVARSTVAVLNLVPGFSERYSGERIAS